MKTKSRFLALLLALILLLAVPCAVADESGTREEYEAAREIQVQQLYARLLDCENVFDVFSAWGDMTEENVDAFYGLLSDEQKRSLDVHMDGLASAMSLEEVVELAALRGLDTTGMLVTPPANYTEVAPLANGPVQVVRSARSVVARALPSDQKGLILAKEAKDNGNGTYTITLESYVTGSVSHSEKSVPADIVLVLDESGSMDESAKVYEKVYELNTKESYYVKSGDAYIKVSYCKGGILNTHSKGWYTGIHFLGHWGTRYDPMTSANDKNTSHVQFYKALNDTQKKREILIAAANEFVDKVYNDATTNNVDHRVSVIGFSTDSSIKIGLEDDIRNNHDAVKSAISSLNANGGTYIEKGMSNAKSVFDNAAASASLSRKRVVVVFTDGIPGTGSWSDSTISESANPAIATSRKLKNDYKATVYTIGMLADANPELEISDEANDAARTNKFLHYLSSNYPNASSMSNGGSGSNKGYYLSASDIASLQSIFSKIAQEIETPTIELDTSTEVRDVVTPYFTMPAEASVKTYTADYNGNEFGARKEQKFNVKVVGDKVSVTGFDYSKNFVTDTQKSDGSYGKKLIIEFTVRVKDGFLGGNDVPTNGADSGVYTKDGTSVKKFDVPTVNVPIPDVTVTAEDKNVYLLGGVTPDQLKTGATVKAGNTELKLREANYGLADWQKEYVDIDVKITDKDGNVVSAEGLKDLVDDTTYTIQVTVSPKPENDGEKSSGTPATEKTGEGTGHINVYKPEVTFKDSAIDLGTTANYSDNQGTQFEVWMHDRIVADPTKMIGEKPELDYSYSPVAGAFTQDTPVEVTVKINGVDRTEYVTFYRDACDYEGCTHREGETVSSTDDNRVNFIVHVKSFDLKIVKTGWDEVDENQSFLFTVSDGTNTLEVVIHGSKNGENSVIIKGLKPGENYTVTEIANWSWRYTPTGGNSRTVNTTTWPAENGVVTVTFNNNRKETKWLDGNTYCDNRWIDKQKVEPEN